MTPHARPAAPLRVVALAVGSAVGVAVLVGARPHLSGSPAAWSGDDLALAGTWLLAVVCAAWLTLITLAYLAAIVRGDSARAARVAGWAPPIARRVLQAALVCGTLVPAAAYAAPSPPLTLHVSSGGRLVAGPGSDPSTDVPVVRTPESTPAPAPTTPSTVPAVRSTPAPPHPPATTSSPAPPASRTHVVRAGDNLWRIARDEVMRAGGTDRVDNRAVARYWRRVVDTNRPTLRSGDPSLIFPGEIVTLPDATD